MSFRPAEAIPRRNLITAGVIVIFSAFAWIYLPDVGHGFVKDDFNWIAHGRLGSMADLKSLFAAPSGFFRPVVSISFAADRAVCGLSPRCYGLTNFLMAIACGASIAVLGRQLSLKWSSAILASSLWAFNWHGINMATLWISGRTALLLVLFSSLSAAAFVRRQWRTAALLTFGAMLSKEEAILLPAVLMSWSVVTRRKGRRSLDDDDRLYLVASAIIECLYFYLRAGSGAFTVNTAPVFYRFSFTVGRVLSNAAQYLDRSATFIVVAVLLFWIISRPVSVSFTKRDNDIVAFGVLWWIGGLAITVFLSVRSSLYACLPSVGIALIGSCTIESAWHRLTAARQNVAVIAGFAFPFLLWPGYHARNRPSVREAELSARTLVSLERIRDRYRPPVVVCLEDDRSKRPSLQDAFGTLLQQAVSLVVSNQMTAYLSPPPNDAKLAGLQTPRLSDITLTLRDGLLVQVKPTQDR